MLNEAVVVCLSHPGIHLTRLKEVMKTSELSVGCLRFKPDTL
jgi:hypothetical protein